MKGKSKKSTKPAGCGNKGGKTTDCQSTTDCGNKDCGNK